MWTNRVLVCRSEAKSARLQNPDVPSLHNLTLQGTASITSFVLPLRPPFVLGFPMALDATARRRWFGAVVLLAALGMLICGETVLRGKLGDSAVLILGPAGSLRGPGGGVDGTVG